MPDIIGALERARTIELEINTQIEHIERLHRIAKRAQDSREYAQSTAEKLAQLERQLNDTIDRMCSAKAEALKYISVLTGEERSVIEGYYILAKSWDRLAQDLYMSERRVYLLRKKALTRLLDRYSPGSAVPGRADCTARR